MHRRHESVGFDVRERDVEVAGEATGRRRAVEADLRDAPADAVPEPVPERADASLLVLALRERESHRGPEPDDAWHVERPGAEPALVPAAVEDRREPHARV